MTFAKLANVYDPELGAIAALVFVAAVELLCSLYPGDDGASYIAQCAAGCFLVLAILVVMSIVRFERQC